MPESNRTALRLEGSRLLNQVKPMEVRLQLTKVLQLLLKDFEAEIKDLKAENFILEMGHRPSDVGSDLVPLDAVNLGEAPEN